MSTTSLIMCFDRDRHNPFLDPPLSALSDGTDSGFPTRFTQEGTRSSRQDSFAPLLPPQSFRPDFARNPSEAGTFSSATSMQIFNNAGQLRVTNDPNEIPTPAVSHCKANRPSHTSLPTLLSFQFQLSRETSRASRLTNDTDNARGSFSEYSQQSGAKSERAVAPPPSSNDGHSYLSHKSVATDQTADHYASEPRESAPSLSVTCAVRMKTSSANTMCLQNLQRPG